MSPESQDKKGFKVFAAASQLNISSEALVSILKELGFAPRGYSAYITKEEFEAVKNRLKQEKAGIKESLKRKAQRSAAREARSTDQVAQSLVDKPLLPSKTHKTKIKKPMVKIESEPVTRSAETKVKVTPYMSVSEIANAFSVSVSDVIKRCLNLGLIATVNHRLDMDTISLLADEFGISIELEEEMGRIRRSRTEELKPRPPVVVVMGHVDHGKTALIDYIRKTKVAESEYGGITQHTGAYTVNFKGNKIVFLDTPGHEAFTAMRARGAQVTDIAILVVAADDGVMAQTVEALNHARAAGVPVIVAITKMDLANANPERVKSQLAGLGLLVESYGGSTICVETSSRTGSGIDELLSAILVLSLEANLSAPFSGYASGTVIDAKIDKGRGIIATVLVQEGTLKKGDAFVCGEHYGKVRELLNENYLKIPEATPSIPVQVLGFSGLPEAGDRFYVVDDERIAREMAQRRSLAKRDIKIKRGVRPKLTLESLQEQIVLGKIKELPIVLKSDVSGSAEALKESLEGLSLDEVKIKVIHSGIGPITMSDIYLAQASDAIVVGYHVEELSNEVKDTAEQEGVEIRKYRIIYNAIDDIRAAMLGLLEPVRREVSIGKAVVRQVFNIPRVGIIAGSYVLEGEVERDALVKVIRGEREIYKGKVSSLKRFKDDVKSVVAGYECGIGIGEIGDILVDDVLEFYRIEEVGRN